GGEGSSGGGVLTVRCVKACGGILFPISLLLSVSACVTFEDGSATPAATNSWERAPRARLDDGKSRRGPAAVASSADTTRGETTYLEGTGRFVGEQRLRARSFAPETSEDAVTLNLVNVPAPQAAKTILGDMFGIKYTVDPGIEGKITIQTPNPVSRSTVVDLFQ